MIRACLERFLIFLSVPPSQAVNFQRLRVKPRQKLREGRSEPPPCLRVLRLKGDGGWAGPAVVRQMQVVMGIDKATCVREQQSGVFAQEGHNHDVVHKGGASGPLHIKPCACVCECVWIDIKSTLQNRQGSFLLFLYLSNPQPTDKREHSSSSSGASEAILPSHRVIDRS